MIIYCIYSDYKATAKQLWTLKILKIYVTVKAKAWPYLLTTKVCAGVQFKLNICWHPDMV